MPDWPGYEALKRTLIGTLSGEVLEIGAGKGANLPLLPAEEIPLPSASIDAVLSTAVLCSAFSAVDLERYTAPGLLKISFVAGTAYRN